MATGIPAMLGAPTDAPTLIATVTCTVSTLTFGWLIVVTPYIFWSHNTHPSEHLGDQYGLNFTVRKKLFSLVLYYGMLHVTCTE